MIFDFDLDDIVSEPSYEERLNDGTLMRDRDILADEEDRNTICILGTAADAARWREEEDQG